MKKSKISIEDFLGKKIQKYFLDKIPEKYSEKILLGKFFQKKFLEKIWIKNFPKIFFGHKYILKLYCV